MVEVRGVEPLCRLSVKMISTYLFRFYCLSSFVPPTDGQGSRLYLLEISLFPGDHENSQGAD